MFASAAFSSRPFASGQIPTRQTLLAATAGEYGWSAWTYSKTAKLNAWAWHGLGVTGTANINAWSQLGNSVYLRRDGDQSLYLMQPDVYFLASETNSESQAVYAETQWLDFGKPGDLKALTGIDFDGLNVVRVEVYVSVDGDRSGTLADTILVGDSQGGWTYSGGILPVNAASTEFRLRFVGDPNLEVQINRLSLYFEDLGTT